MISASKCPVVLVFFGNYTSPAFYREYIRPPFFFSTSSGFLLEHLPTHHGWIQQRPAKIQVWDFQGYFCTHNFKGHPGIVSLVSLWPQKVGFVNLEARGSIFACRSGEGMRSYLGEGKNFKVALGPCIFGGIRD